MRFGFWPGGTLSFQQVRTLAEHVEKTGWDGLWYADHFMENGRQTGAPMPECWTTLAGIAATVPRIRIGPLVTGNTYRHPAVLAKMAATVDHISGGRLVLGLGSGWQENEHSAYGIPFYTVNRRLRRLEEACQVIKELFANEFTTFEGRFYRLTEAPLNPKPAQARLPLLIGGGGEQVTLRIAARYADEWNVWGNVATLTHKMSILDRYCEEIGRDPAEIQRSAVALLFLSDDEAFLKRIREGGAARPSIVGNVSEVRDIVGAYVEAGVDELIIPDFTLGNEPSKIATLDRFMTEVASQFH